MKVEVIKWKTNGHKVKHSHAFNATYGDVNYAYSQRALCGKTIPAYFDVDSRKVWAVKRITCPKCKEVAKSWKAVIV